MEIADHAPEEFKEASLIASMPMLGTLATGIRAKYRDGELNSASFIVSIEAPQASKGNIRYLDALPKEFTKEDLVSLRLSNNESPVVKTIIYRWGKEGKIEQIDANLWRKI